MKRKIYAETCTLHCTDNDNVLEGEILNFRPEAYLDVSVNRELKIKLRFDSNHKIYVGSMSGYEFTTKGPDELG